MSAATMRSRRVWRLVAAVCGVVVVGLGALTLRVRAGPLDLGFLTPYLARTLSEGEAGLQVELGGTELMWRGWAHLDLSARDVVVRNRDGRALVAVPRVFLDLSPWALLRGRLAVSALEVEGARVDLVVGTDGDVEVGGETAPAPADVAKVAQAVVGALTDRDRTGPLGHLKTVRVWVDEARIAERERGVAWIARPATVELERAADGLSGSGRLAIGNGDTRAAIALNFDYRRATDLVEAGVTFTDLQPALLGDLLADVGTLDALEVPLGGTIALTLDREGVLRNLDFEITAPRGTVALPPRIPTPFAIRDLRMRGLVDARARRLEIEEGAVVLGDAAAGPTVRVIGVLAERDDALEIGATVRLARLPVDDLGAYWPPTLAATPRAWVTANVGTGEVAAGALYLALRVPQAEAGPVRVERFDGTLDYRDLTVTSTQRLPPITGVTGSGVFDQSSLRFRVERGALGALPITRADVDLLALDTDRERIAIAGETGGSLAALLALLADDLPGLTAALAADDAEAGRADVQLALSFPLTTAVTYADLDVDGEATLRGAPVAETLGDGVMAGTVRYAKRAAGFGQVDVDLDLKDARLEVGALGFAKPSGRPGRARVRLALDGARPMAVEQADVVAGSLRLQGAARFDAAGDGLTSLDLERLAWERTMLDQVRVRWREGHPTIDLQGDVLDAGPLLAGRGGGDGAPFTLTATLGELHLGPERFLLDVALDVARGDARWERLEVEATVPPEIASRRAQELAARRVSVDYGPAGDGARRLDLRTGDMGGLLRVLGVTERIEGGRVTLTGRSAPPGPETPLEVAVDAQAFRSVDAPLLARLLALASLDRAVFSGRREVTFERLFGTVTVDGERLKTELLRAHGPALGITARGMLHLGDGALDLEGTIVPAYTVNRVLGAIPGLGPILSGGGTTGIAAATYTVRGSAREPDVRVNPLSALTPRFLRGVWGLLEGGKGAEARALPED